MKTKLMICALHKRGIDANATKTNTVFCVCGG